MLDELQKIIGYVFRDEALLRLAMTHSTYRNENNLSDDNQRLEFLGDAALGLVAAEYGYLHPAGLEEGKLTVLRSSACSAAALTGIAREIKLGRYLMLGKGEESSGGREKERNLADALEALIGACYLDGGLDAVRGVFHQLFLARLTEPALLDRTDNPKGLLQEWAQKRGFNSPVYTLVLEEGPPHQPLFTVQASIEGCGKATGSGTSKRSAEAAAAKELMHVLSCSPE